MSSPGLNFAIGGQASKITPQSPQWCAPLPMDRQAVVIPPSRAAGPTYGQYFIAAGNFLKKDRWNYLTRAAGEVFNKPVPAETISSVNVHLIKHGALYHPSLVTTRIGGRTLRFVLNVAIGDEGRRVLPQEYALLLRLNRHYPQNLIPRVYVCGEADSDDALSWKMFLGQWFEDFHEFHITPDDRTRANKWLVWDTDNGCWALSRSQVADMYRQCAYILAYFFNPISFEAVLDWHHAAGDFVLRRIGRNIQVRLITVRRYAPFIQTDQCRTPSLEDLLDAAVLFLLRTSLWLRLDRLDGVGGPIWADDFVLSSVWQGFNQGFSAMAHLHGLPQELVTGIADYLAAQSKRQLIDLGSALSERIPGAAEKKIVADHLREHVAALSMIARSSR